MNRKLMRGASFGLMSGIFWAIDTVLIGLILSMTTFLEFRELLLVAPLISTFLHDAFSAVWMVLLLAVKGELRRALSMLKKKPGRFAVLAGVLGGPVGMLFYVLALQNMGASYTTVISTTYPAVGAFFAYIIVKDRLAPKNWLGLLMSMAFIVLLSYSGELVVGTNISLGLIFVLICISGWGLECVVSAYAMKDGAIKPEHVLLIRQITSSVVFGLVIIPVFIGHSYTAHVITGGPAVLLIGAVALAGTLSYVMYYNAINILGPIRAMALNISYAAWAVLFEAILLGAVFSPKEYAFALMIIVGSILTVMENRKKGNSAVSELTG